MNKTIEIELNADTTNLTLKLRAIAKHAESLANELDSIDDIYNEDLPTRLEGSD